YKKELKSGKVNPRDLKKKLALEIVRMYHSAGEAEKAEKEFDKVFQKKELPSVIPQAKMKQGEMNVLDFLVKLKMAPSKSEAKRLILQNGVRIGGEVQKDWKKTVKTKKGLIVQVGKRKFIKLA
ncbi:MAG: tyrosine--tRNA ligase, partial [Planctomycetaceae bacterium]